MVGVSGYTVRPPEARKKPRVSAFINANFDKIEALRPDLIFAFSDLQADIAAELVRRGYPVFTFNQRSVDEILQMILVVGGIVGRADRAQTAGRPTAIRPRDDSHGVGGMAAATTRLLRGMGRPADLRDPVGRGTRRDCRRRAHLPGAFRRGARERPHRRSRRGHQARSGGHRRVVVWQGRQDRADRQQGRMGRGIGACAMGTSTRSSPSTSCSPVRRR